MKLTLNEVRTLKEYLQRDSEELLNLYKDRVSDDRRWERAAQIAKAMFYKEIGNKLGKIEDDIMVETTVDIVKSEF